jgi:hypothetical protein
VFLFCIAGGVFLTFLTCVDSDSKSQNINQSLEYQEKQNPQSKIGLSTFSPKSEMKTDNDFALVVLGRLSVGTSKTFYVDGPFVNFDFRENFFCFFVMRIYFYRFFYKFLPSSVAPMLYKITPDSV